MLKRFRITWTEYPPQYWLLFIGRTASFTGASLVWPYLLLYISKTLELPLMSITWLISLSYGIEIIASFVAGPIVDRLGRKFVIVLSLLISGMAYLSYTQAQSLTAFAIAGVFIGLANPLYKVGSNAMISDMIRREKRPEAYALMRLGFNLAVVIGPPIGGFLVTSSYQWAFLGAAAGMLSYAVWMVLLGRETLPDPVKESEANQETFRGYGKALQDGHFLVMVGSLTLTQLCAGIMWNLLSVFTNTEFNLPEKDFGWIPMTNALMVVFIQVWVTSQTKRRSPLVVMSLGSLFFAAGVGSVALGETFWAFWASMVVMTIGELMVIPTADTYVAGLAPVNMRGRYMGIAGLAWSIGNGIGPTIGGFLNDAIKPDAIWYGAFVLGTAGAMGFLILEMQKWRSRKARGRVES